MVLVPPLVVWCLGDGLGLRALSGRESTGEKDGESDAAGQHVLIHRTAATKATMATAITTTTKVVAKAAMRWRG